MRNKGMQKTKNNNDAARDTGHLFTIYSRTTGALTGAMRRQSVINIYRESRAFITLADDESGIEIPYYVTAEGGLRKIESKRDASAEMKTLDILMRKNGYESRDDARRRRAGVALMPSIHRAA